MEFFLDTASLEEIKQYQKLGLVDGVTTNPALLAKEGQEPIKQINKIASMVSGPISVEVTYTEPEKMIAQARMLAKLGENIIIKLSTSVAGLIAAQELKKNGMKLNITLIFHPSQAVPFVKTGADYVSLFVGRVEDFGLSNKNAIHELKRIILEMKSATKLLAASIRNPDYLVEAVAAGSDVLTVPPSCWEKVYTNPLFHLGEKEFLESWKQLSPDIRRNYEVLA